jgi:hypothetical protein
MTGNRPARDRDESGDEKMTKTCQCCGGSLPSQYVWEFARDNVRGECAGSVDSSGQCRAFNDDDRRDVYSVQTDGFSTDEFQAASLDAAIEEAFTGEGLGRITDVDSLERKFAKYVEDGGWCKIECNGQTVIEIGVSP